MNIEFKRENAIPKVSKVICDNLGNPQIIDEKLIRQGNKFYSFKIPSSWKRHRFKEYEKNLEAKYVATKNGKNAILDIIIKEENVLTRDKLIEHFEFMLVWNGHNIIGKENISFTNNMHIANKFDFETSNERGTQIISVIGNVAYMITYQASPELFQEYLNDFENIVGSFEDKSMHFESI